MEEIIELLKTVHPFDTLTKDSLEKIAHSTQIGYYKKNSIILDYDESVEFFYIILKGVVKEIDKDEIVVDVYKDLDSFDAKSLINKKSENRFETSEETICYEIKKEAFLEVLDTSTEFKNYFLLGISHKLQKIKEQNKTKIISEFLSAKIEDTILNKPNIVNYKTSIVESIKKLEESRAQILIVQKENIFGVFTDKDLRKVILKNIPSTDSIEKLASFPAVTIDYNDFLFNALLKMTNFGIKHLVVLKENSIVGTLEITDILSYFSNQAYLISKNIENANSLDELKIVSNRFYDMIKILYHKGIKVRYLAKLMDELHQKLYKKIFELIFGNIKGCSLIVFGSEGRGEQILRTDQDNALIIEDFIPKNIFEKKTIQFTNALIELGYPKCPGKNMVSNPYWRKHKSEYEAEILNWIENPTEENFLKLSIFIDAITVSGNDKNLEDLKEIIFDRVSDNFSFLANLAKATISFSTPLGFFNRFLTDNKNRVDIKKGGIFPIVHGARVLALQYRIKETNSIKRIKEISKLNIINKEFAIDLIEAFETFQNFRLKTSIKNIELGLEPTNEIEIDELSKIEKDLLKDSFKIVDNFKKFIKYHFRLDIVT